MRKLVGVVNNREPWWSEVTPSDTDTEWASTANRNVSLRHSWGFTMAAVWHTLTWYMEKMVYFSEAGDLLPKETLGLKYISS